MRSHEKENGKGQQINKILPLLEVKDVEATLPTRTSNECSGL